MRKTFHIPSFLILLLFTTEIFAQKPSIYTITRMPFNTGGFSNISPVIVKDGIIFCSNRRLSGITDRTGFDGGRLYNFYIAEKKDSNDFEKPRLLKSDRTTKFNSGPLCIAPDGVTIYFTSEVETGKMAEDKHYRNHSGIFYARLNGTELGPINPFRYNDPGYDLGQPSVSPDGKYIFFASDKPGGNGRSDLYYSELVNGEWTAPVNLGLNVNTSSSENYPYMHPSGRLYFSSDRPGGSGQLDVYYTTLNHGLWEKPVLLPEPINSSSDDFAFVADKDLQTGYFASNRKTDDYIYRFESAMIRKAVCDTLQENNYCYRFYEENAVKYDTMPFRYDWNFGDGTSDTGNVVVHCFSKPGVYTVQLDVTNLVTKEVSYNEKSQVVDVTAIEQPYITSPDQIDTNKSINLSAGETNLPGWRISRYYWNFGDETVAVGSDVSKSYLKPGTYNIQLIVTEDAPKGSVAREACVSKNIIVN